MSKERLSRLQKLTLYFAAKNNNKVNLAYLTKEYFNKPNLTPADRVLLSRSLRLLRERGYIYNKPWRQYVELTDKGAQKAKEIL